MGRSWRDDCVERRWFRGRDGEQLAGQIWEVLAEYQALACRHSTEGSCAVWGRLVRGLIHKNGGREPFCHYDSTVDTDRHGRPEGEQHRNLAGLRIHAVDGHSVFQRKVDERLCLVVAKSEEWDEQVPAHICAELMSDDSGPGAICVQWEPSERR